METEIIEIENIPTQKYPIIETNVSASAKVIIVCGLLLCVTISTHYNIANYYSLFGILLGIVSFIIKGRVINYYDQAVNRTEKDESERDAVYKKASMMDKIARIMTIIGFSVIPASAVFALKDLILILFM